MPLLGLALLRLPVAVPLQDLRRVLILINILIRLRLDLARARVIPASPIPERVHRYRRHVHLSRCLLLGHRGRLLLAVHARTCPLLPGRRPPVGRTSLLSLSCLDILLQDQFEPGDLEVLLGETLICQIEVMVVLTVFQHRVEGVAELFAAVQVSLAVRRRVRLCACGRVRVVLGDADHRGILEGGRGRASLVQDELVRPLQHVDA